MYGGFTLVLEFFFFFKGSLGLGMGEGGSLSWGLSHGALEGVTCCKAQSLRGMFWNLLDSPSPNDTRLNYDTCNKSCFQVNPVESLTALGSVHRKDPPKKKEKKKKRNSNIQSEGLTKTEGKKRAPLLHYPPPPPITDRNQRKRRKKEKKRIEDRLKSPKPTM